MTARNGWLLALIVLVVVISLVVGSCQEGAEFAGTDGQAMDAVTALRPDYEPWFNPVWEPEGEIESLLFALQAALGAGVLGYYLGFRRGQTQGRRNRVDAGD
jgi:cobalt/nickel transport protein